MPKTIPPFKLVPQPLNDDARALKDYEWAPAEIGTRHQLGGEPDFIQKSRMAQMPELPGKDDILRTARFNGT